MPIKDNKNYSFSFSMIDIKKIDPSPYQHRKFFDEDSLRELGASIVRDGLTESIKATIEIIDVEMGKDPGI
jgi:ParB-like chromosome segregation protein Spo0J